MGSIIIWLTFTFIIISKFFDCYTTSIQITHINQEENKFARVIMKKFGIKKTIWGIFILSILISLLSVYLVFEWYYHWYYIMLYALGGIIVTVFQTAIAYTNHTHRLNFITKIILKFKNYSN